jgi:hypothetical protein
MGDSDTALEHHFLHFAQAHIEPEIEPDGTGNNVDWKAMVLVGWCGPVHAAKLPPLR